MEMPADFGPDSERIAQFPPATRSFFAFFRATHLHRQLMARRMVTKDMHPGQAISLGMLAHVDGITQAELAERLHVSRPTVTVMLQKMEKAGLIERRPDEHDQRYTRIHVTDAGRELHSRMHAVMSEINEEVFGPLSEKDQTELARLLLAISANMSAAMQAADAETTADDDEDERPAG